MSQQNDLKPLALQFKIFLDAVYLIGSIGGSAIVASNTGNNFFGYFLFLLASIAGIILIIQSNVSKSVLWVSIYFLLINIFGLIRHL